MPDFETLMAGVDRVLLDAFKKLNGSIQYTPGAGGAPITVDAIWDNRFVQADVGRMGASAEGPQVFMRLSDLPDNPESGDPTFTIEGKDYRVTQVQPDGVGGAVILLAER